MALITDNIHRQPRRLKCPDEPIKQQEHEQPDGRAFAISLNTTYGVRSRSRYLSLTGASIYLLEESARPDFTSSAPPRPTSSIPLTGNQDYFQHSNSGLELLYENLYSNRNMYTHSLSIAAPPCPRLNTKGGCTALTRTGKKKKTV